MIDPRENYGAVMELKRLAIQKVWGITDDEAEAYATSGLSLFAWMNMSPLGADWRARMNARHERRIQSRLRRWWSHVFAKGMSDGGS